MRSFAELALDAVAPHLLVRRTPRPVDAGGSLPELCRSALERPTGSPALMELAQGARSITVIVSDASRDEPRSEMLSVLREAVPWERVTLVVAAGTHAASADVVPPAFRDRPITVPGQGSRWVDLGRTPRGTRVRLLAEVAEAELVIATGRIRPHYFAGFSGGAKAIFPGSALPEDALDNHRLKADPSARLGRVEDNACRLDMEAAARLLPGRAFMLNVLSDVEGTPVAAAAGDPVAAHRALLAKARELFTVSAPRTRVVVVADRPPVTSSLYQASKLLPPAGALLSDGGIVILLADLTQGIGPVERVNRGIYELGVRPQLPLGHRVLLVSGLDAAAARAGYAEPRPSLDSALAEAFAATGERRAVVLWRAGETIAVAE